MAADMASGTPQGPRWVTNLLVKRANKPLMSPDDSKKAATSTGWKARRFWEKVDMTHYAHNALQQMGVPKGHVLYDRLYKKLTEGVSLTDVTKTNLLKHLGLAQRLGAAEMQLTMDDVLSIYILGEKSAELDRALTKPPGPAAGHGSTAPPVPGPAGDPSPPRRSAGDKKRQRSESASPTPASKRAATSRPASEVAPVLGAGGPASAGGADTPREHGVQDTHGAKADGASKPEMRSIFIYDSDDSDQL